MPTVLPGGNANITVDTSVAHVAAASGVPTLRMLTPHPDARWGPRGRRTPWYRSLWMVRQWELGDWAEAATEAARLIRSGELPPRLVKAA